MERLVTIPLLLQRKLRLRDEVIFHRLTQLSRPPILNVSTVTASAGLSSSFRLLEVAFFMNDVCTILPQGGTKLWAGLAQRCWGFISC